MLLQSGFVFVIIGALVEGMKVDMKLKSRFKGNPVMQKISGNLGIIFFVVGVVLILAGLYDLYYG
jgi:hypothetical protein